jgi:hypothetical protein
MIPAIRVPPWRKVAAVPLIAAACLVSASSPAAAQPPGVAVTESSTGLFTLARGHSASVYLVDVGDPEAAPTDAVIELLDATGTVLRRTRGELRPGQSVRLTWNGPATGSYPIRARALLRTPEENTASSPMLTLEVHNQQTFDSFANATCRLKFDPEGTGGKVLGNCGSCETAVTFDR